MQDAGDISVAVPESLIERRAMEKALREEIEVRVRQIARLKTVPEPFNPARRQVRYAGRVFGEAEMVNPAWQESSGRSQNCPFGHRRPRMPPQTF